MSNPFLDILQNKSPSETSSYKGIPFLNPTSQPTQTPTDPIQSIKGTFSSMFSKAKEVPVPSISKKPINTKRRIPDNSTAGIVLNTISGIPEAGANVFRDILQGVARTVGTVGISVGNTPTKLGNLMNGENKPLPFDSEIPTNTTPLGRTLFGGQPIRDIKNASENAQEKLNQLASTIKGEPTKLNPSFGLPLAVGGILMDLSGFGGKAGVKTFTDEIPEAFIKYVAREKSAGAIEETLKKIGLDEVNSKNLSEMLAPLGTKNEVKNALIDFSTPKNTTDNLFSNILKQPETSPPATTEKIVPIKSDEGMTFQLQKIDSTGKIISKSNFSTRAEAESEMSDNSAKTTETLQNKDISTLKNNPGEEINKNTIDTSPNKTFQTESFQDYLPEENKKVSDVSNEYWDKKIQPSIEKEEPVIIGADDLKDHFGKDYKDENHKIYSRSAYRIYEEVLPKVKNPIVYLTGGGPASGKTDFIVGNIKSRGFNGIIYDSNMANYSGIVNQIELARKYGKEVEIAGIIPDLDMARKYSILRANEIGRDISAKTFANGHVGFPETIIKLLENKIISKDKVHILDTRDLTDREQFIQKVLDKDYLKDPLATLKELEYNKEEIIKNYEKQHFNLKTGERESGLAVRKGSDTSLREDRTAKNKIDRQGDRGSILQNEKGKGAGSLIPKSSKVDNIGKLAPKSAEQFIKENPPVIPKHISVKTTLKTNKFRKEISNIQQKINIDSVVNTLKDKEALIEIAKESLRDSPFKELEPYVADAGNYKGELPEVVGKPISEIKKMEDFKGVRNEKALEFAQRGDVIVDGINQDYGLNLDSEDGRAEFEKYQQQKKDIAAREKELKTEIGKFKKKSMFDLVVPNDTLIGDITSTKETPQAIKKIYEQVAKEKKIIREHVLNHPARPLMKYVGKDNKLPMIGSKTNFGKEGEQILKDLKFSDRIEANKAIADYIIKKNEFINPLGKLRLEERNAKFLRDKQKIIAEVEKRMRAEGKNRKNILESVKEYFYLTDSEMQKSIGTVDYRLLSDADFNVLAEKVQDEALKIAEHNVAVSEVEWTIAQKELHRVENLQQAMGLPTDLTKLTTDQLNTLNEILGKFEDRDVFLGTREIETLAKNTDLPHVKTQRQILEEVLGKRTGVPVEKLKEITVGFLSDFRSAVSLARQNPFYDILVKDAYKLKIESGLKFTEIELKTNKLVKEARNSRKRGFFQRIAPTDDMVISYLEEGDEQVREMIASQMSKAELDLAHYVKQQYADMRDYLLKLEMLDKYRENYYTHRPRGFLEAWLRDGATKSPIQFVKAFGRAFKETIFDIHKLDEANFKILNEQTSEILPLEKFFKYSLRRSGKLIPTKNIANAFLGYVKTFETKRGLDQYIPKMESVARALTPTETTEGGVLKDTSLERFVKRWINTQKGRPTSLMVINPGDTIDTVLRTGVAFTRFIDLALRVPAQFMSLVGEESMSWINLGNKRYLKGQLRSRTQQGKVIAKRYESFVGRTFWDKMKEQSHDVGSKTGEVMYAFYGIASRNANIHHLLGTLTKDEFRTGNLTPDRLAEIKMEMNRWRADDLLASVIGKTSIGAVFREHKSWATPILNQVASNLKSLTKMVASGEYKNAAKSKEFGELFRATLLTTILVLTARKIYNELQNNKDRSFVEELGYRALNDAFSFISALSPTTLFVQPRLMSWIGQLSGAISQLSVGIATNTKTKTGEIPGLSAIEKSFVPKIFGNIFTATKEDKLMTNISTSTTSAQKKLDLIEDSISEPAQKAWEEVKKAGVETEKAQEIVDVLSEEEYVAYKLAKGADNEYWIGLAKQMVPVIEKASKFGFGSEEADTLVADISDDEYKAYKLVKTAYLGKFDENGPSKWDEQSFMQHISNLSKGWSTDPATAFDNLIHGDWKITQLKNGQIIVDRIPMSASQEIKEKAAKNNADFKLDHIIPLTAGGTNRISNLQIVSTETWAETTVTETFLGKALEDGEITGKQAREYIIRLKGSKRELTPELQKEYVEKYDSKPITLEEIKAEIKS